MSSFSHTYAPPTLRLGNTADPIMVVPRNTATVVTRVELVRPIVVRLPKPERRYDQVEARPVIRRRAKRR